MASNSPQSSGADQRSIKVDEAFIAACANTGVTLQELEAKTLDDFTDGAQPAASSPSATTPSTPRQKSSSSHIPKDILERRHKNYEALRLRKLHLVLVERDRLLKKGFGANNNTAAGGGAGEPTPRAPPASSSSSTAFIAAPPPGRQGINAVPRPPPVAASSSGAYSRNNSNAAAASDYAPLPEARKSTLEPLDFGDGPKKTSSSARKPSNATPMSSSARGNSSTSRPGSSRGSVSTTNNNTPRLPPCDGATGSGYNSARKSQRELLLENAQRQHKQRVSKANRLAQATMLKEVREEDQQRRAAEVQMREMEEAKRREERARIIHQANLLQSENRAKRDKLLKKMREENARAHVEMGTLELEAKAREIEEVRRKQQEILNEKKHSMRTRNETAMLNAKEKQLDMAERYEANLERKGLLHAISGNPNSSSSTSAALMMNTTTASGGGGGADGGALTVYQKPMGESEMQRSLKKMAEQQRFQQKHEREAQRLATAAELAEQNRLKALLTIQKKAQKSAEHQSREAAAKEEYIQHNYNTTMYNMDKTREARERQEVELNLYREQLEAERRETQQQRDQRIFMERELEKEDRMAKDEWRRSVLERSRRYEELKQFDADVKSRAKQEAAEQRRREIKEAIAAINAGALDGDYYDDGQQEGYYIEDGHDDAYVTHQGTLAIQ